MTRVFAAFHTIGSLTREKTRFLLIHVMLTAISGAASFALVGLSALIRFLPSAWLPRFTPDARFVTSNLVMFLAAFAIMYGTSHLNKALELTEEARRPRKKVLRNYNQPSA